MSSSADTLKTKAHVWPFAAFMLGLMLLPLVEGLVGWDHPDAVWWKKDVAQWIYPIQVVVCSWLVLRYWKLYEFNLTLGKFLLGVGFGAMGIGLWLLPTVIFDRMGFGYDEAVPMWLARLGVASRAEGFNPGEVFAPGSGAYWASTILRFFRAAVVVALVEEIFWRGFLMRYVMNPDGKFWEEPFGRPTMRSYLIVTAAFMAIHASVDWPAALVYGSLTYLLTVKSKSLGAVVTMHFTANLLMGLFAVSYGKYGLW